MKFLLRHLLVVLVCLWSERLTAKDLRDQFGTRSMACAEALDQAIELSGKKEHQTAFAQAKRAAELDPECELAHFWCAVTLCDLGQIEESFAVSEKLIELSLRLGSGVASNVGVEAAVNMGLTYGRLGENAQSVYWLSKAATLDLANRCQLHWKIYRNMAISAHSAGDSLSALLQALKAKELAPTRVEDEMIRDFLKAAREQPVINVLYFSREPVDLSFPVRSGTPQLEPAEKIEAALQQETVSCMVPDVRGRRFFIFYDGKPTADIVDLKAGAVKAISLSSPVAAAALGRDGLYAARAGDPVLDRLAADGQVKGSYNLTGAATSVAVCPYTQQAFVTIDANLVIIDLASGKLTETDAVGQVVRLDAARRIAYTTYKPPQQYQSGHLMVGGRPVFFSSMGDVFADQNVIMKAAYDGFGHSALGTIRTEAASNGYTLAISGAGKWVTVTGGGGYRGPGGKGGYGTGVLCADDLGQLQGFYATEAYPKASAFNPVTDQLAVSATKELKVFNLGNERAAFQVPGKFRSVLEWSADGQYLFAAVDGVGARVFRNGLLPEDADRFVALQTAMVKEIKRADAMAKPRTSAEHAAQPELARFRPTTSLTRAQARARRAVETTATEALPSWRQVERYQSPDLADQVHEINQDYKRENPGLGIYRIKKVLKQDDDYLPALFALGHFELDNNNPQAAVTALLTVVQQDAGRTDLTTDALSLLAVAYHNLEDKAASLDCLAASLELDPQDGLTAQVAADLLPSHGIAWQTAEAAPQRAVTSAGRPDLQLPGKPRRSRKPMSSEKLFEIAAARTVRIRTDHGVGSGVCITDEGHILTCDHVVAGSTSSIDVTMFKLAGGKLVESASSKAEIVFHDRDADIAVLAVQSPASTLKALTLATDEIRPGQKVVVIGSPGMDATILDQSVTDGIISADSREFDGKTWIQHTAAVNPGNSGGPLLSLYGEIVGLVTLKADLENVSFAVPVARLRRILSAD